MPRCLAWQPEANRDNPDGCVYFFHAILFGSFFVWFQQRRFFVAPRSLSLKAQNGGQKTTGKIREIDLRWALRRESNAARGR